MANDVKERLDKAIEKYNSTHDKKLVFVRDEKNTLGYAAIYSRDGKEYIAGGRYNSVLMMAPKNDHTNLDFMDEFLETLK